MFDQGGEASVGDGIGDEPAAGRQGGPAGLDHAGGADAAAEKDRVGLGQASERRRRLAALNAKFGCAERESVASDAVGADS